MKVTDLYEGYIFHNIHIPADIEVLEIKEDENILRVSILVSCPWEEDWNLAHTLVGFKRGDYIDLTDFHESLDRIYKK